MTSSGGISWQVLVSPRCMGYLGLCVALLVDSCHCAILDLGYAGVRDLADQSDVRLPGYSDTRDRLPDGSRIKKLLRISKQLDKSTLTQALQSTKETKLSNNVVQELARGVSLLIEALSDPPTKTPVEADTDTAWENNIEKRGPHTDIVAEVRSKYVVYYNTLTDFCDNLPSQLLPAAPEGLQDVGVLKTIMTPNDHVFSDADERLFTQKFYTIQELVDAVFAHTAHFLKPDSSTWYWNIFMMLNVDGSAVKAELNMWQSDNTADINGVIAMDAGVGGVNSGVRNDMKTQNLDALGRLINTLNGLIQGSH